MMRLRWFWFGMREHRQNKDSRATDYRQMDAYYDGRAFAWKLPWAVRKHFKADY